jgi:acetylornithine deacetylase/succinyl-diaminopimelate desuccinylase-like protein
VTWLVEGEEEVGSPNLPAFVERHADRLRCAGAIWEEGGTDARGRPQLTLGARGMLYVELGVRALSRDGHSGNANVIPNAAWRLVWALATLKGPDERVRIPGFYDRVRPISDRQRELLQALPSQEDAIREAFGLDQLLLGRTGPEVTSAPFQPTCNIAGLNAGYQGEGSKTVIPAVASAKLDFRLLPDQDPLEVASLLRRHLDAEGFADIGIKVDSGERAAVVDPDDPLVRLTAQAAEEVYGVPAQLVPMSGGTTPMYLFTEKGVPVVTPGVGFGASNLAHSPNENVRIIDFKNAARHVARVLARFGEG